MSWKVWEILLNTESKAHVGVPFGVVGCLMLQSRWLQHLVWGELMIHEPNHSIAMVTHTTHCEPIFVLL